MFSVCAAAQSARWRTVSDRECPSGVAPRSGVELPEALGRFLVHMRTLPSVTRALAEEGLGWPGKARNGQPLFARVGAQSMRTTASTSKSMGSMASFGTGTSVCAGSLSPNMRVTVSVSMPSFDIS